MGGLWEDGGIMTNTYSSKSKIEDLTLEVVQEAVASLKVPDKVIVKIELTPKDYQFIKDNTESTEIVPSYGIPVIVNKKLKKSKIYYKAKLPFCMRCGVDKKKGFWEGGCSSWGTYYKTHVWNNSKKIQKANDELVNSQKV